MKKATTAAVALSAALILTGCSHAGQAVTVGNAAKSTKSAAPVEQGARRILSTTQATAALPTLAQVGTEWAEGKSSNRSNTDSSNKTLPTFTPASCSFSAANGALSDLAVVPLNTMPVAIAEGNFHTPPAADDTIGLTVRALSVTVKSYKDDINAHRLDQIAARLKDCAKFTSGDSAGITTTWQLFPVSLPNYGDGTLAFRMQGGLSFLIVLMDSVQIVTGHNLITITQAGVGKIDTELAGSVAKAVMANLDTATK